MRHSPSMRAPPCAHPSSRASLRASHRQERVNRSFNSFPPFSATISPMFRNRMALLASVNMDLLLRLQRSDFQNLGWLGSRKFHYCSLSRRLPRVGFLFSTLQQFQTLFHPHHFFSLSAIFIFTRVLCNSRVLMRGSSTRLA